MKRAAITPASAAMLSVVSLSGRRFGLIGEVVMRCLILLLMVVLAACATQPQQVRATNPTVTYTIDDRSDLSEAEAMANDYCYDFGQYAYLRSVEERDGTTYAIFDCI